VGLPDRAALPHWLAKVWRGRQHIDVIYVCRATGLAPAHPTLRLHWQVLFVHLALFSFI